MALIVSIIQFIRRKEIGRIGRIAFATLVLISVAVISDNVLYNHSVIESHPQDDVFSSVSLNEINQRILVPEQQGSVYLYIEREGCPACATTTPAIRTYLKNRGCRIFYYDTQEDRDTNREELDKVLSQLGVTIVPSLVKIKGGTVQKRYDADQIIKDFIAGDILFTE